jgi:hypothetical protein
MTVAGAPALPSNLALHYDEERPDMSWPAFFPPDCPPPDAEAVTRQVLRFVEHDPPQAEDFISLLQSGRSVPHDKRCEAAGLSAFTDEADIASQRRRFKGFRRRSVARGELLAEHGATKPTPRPNFQSHVTWWVGDGVQAETLFVVIVGPGDPP